MLRLNPSRRHELRELLDRRCHILQVLHHMGIKMIHVGGIWKGLCHPTFNNHHDTDTPNLTYMENRGANIVHCFACHYTASPVNLYKDFYKKTIDESMFELAHIFGIDVAPYCREPTAEERLKEEIWRLNQVVAEHLHTRLQYNPEPMRWLMNRYGADAIRKWKLGYSVDCAVLTKFLLEEKKFSQNVLDMADIHFRIFSDRIIHPLFDLHGNVTGFSGRIWAPTKEEEAKKYEAEKKRGTYSKYINTSSKSKAFQKSYCPYGLHFSREALRANGGVMIAVEGYADVIEMHRQGFENCIGLMGKSLNRFHVNVLNDLSVRKVILCLDGDYQGQKGILDILKGCQKLEEAQIKHNEEQTLNHPVIQYYAVPLPKDVDPDDFLKEAKNVPVLKSALKTPMTLLDFYVDYRLKNMTEPKTITERVEFIMDIRSVLGKVVPKANLKTTEHRLQQILGITTEDLREATAPANPAPDDTERKVLSSLVADTTYREAMLDVLRRDWFSPNAAILFQAIWKLEQDGKAVTPDGVVAVVKALGYTKQFKGPGDVKGWLQTPVPDPWGLIGQLLSRYYKRRLTELLQEAGRQIATKPEAETIENLKAQLELLRAEM